MNTTDEFKIIMRMMVGDFNPNHDPKDGRFIEGNGTVVLSPQDFDAQTEQEGLTRLYRGYSAGTEEELESIFDSHRKGEARLSGENSSAFGRGLYFSVKEDEAQSYVNRRNAEKGEGFGRVVKAALKKGAKVLGQKEANAMSEQKLEEASAMMRKAFQKDLPAEEQRRYGEQAQNLFNMDLGTYIASKGYDAYVPYGSEVVVVNQKALIIRDKE